MKSESEPNTHGSNGHGNGHGTNGHANGNGHKNGNGHAAAHADGTDGKGGARTLTGDIVYAAKAAKSVVSNLTNVLRTTTVERTLKSAYNVVRTTSWKKNIEYPVMVAVETTNKCNATCWFCPITEGSKRPPTDVEELIQLGKKKNSAVAKAEPEDGVTFNLMSRPLGYMEDWLFEKIVDDCKQFPLRRMEPYLHGEPFMDKKLVERIAYINKHLPQTEVHLFTNGSLLTKKTIEKLKEVNLASMVISLNTSMPEKYNAIMGLDWKKTLANIERVAEENKTDKPIANRFVMRMTAPQETTDEEINRFRKLARKMGARPVIVSLHNYKGDINSERPVPQFPCYFVNDLDILYDGNTALCCMDHDGEYGWGDVKTHSVLEVFNSPTARRYRDLMRQDKRNDLDPCNECNMFWWSLERTGIRRLQYSGRIASYLIKHKPLRL